jgi:hypothetical protein
MLRFSSTVCAVSSLIVSLAVDPGRDALAQTSSRVLCQSNPDKSYRNRQFAEADTSANARGREGEQA